MKKAKIRPLATPEPLNRSSQKLASVITSWTAPDMQNAKFFSDRFRGFCSPKGPNTRFCRAFDVTSFYVRFLFFNKATAYTAEQIFTQNTSNDVVPDMEVPFRVPLTTFYI